MTNWRKLKEQVKNKDFVLAISGGVDSMVLLDFFTRNCRKVTAVHFNHGIHSKSDEIAKFVKYECRNVDNYLAFTRTTPFTSNVECEARKWRYENLETVAGDKLIVTAHHQDDQIETTVMRLMRGIPHHALSMNEYDGNRWKPFLNIPKDELIRTAQNRNINFMVDPTNIDTTYERNWVRHTLIPEMMTRRNVKSSIIRGILQTGNSCDTIS